MCCVRMKAGLMSKQVAMLRVFERHRHREMRHIRFHLILPLMRSCHTFHFYANGRGRFVAFVFRVGRLVTRSRVICVVTIMMTFHLADSFSPLIYRPPPYYNNGPAFLCICRTLRLCAMSSVMLCSFMTSLMLSSHLFLGLIFFYFLALACLPSSWCYLSRPYLESYHLRCLILRKVVIGSRLASLQMSSFVMWSFLVLPLAHLIDIISFVCSF